MNCGQKEEKKEEIWKGKKEIKEDKEKMDFFVVSIIN